jgi:hypothetical protein
MPEEPDEAGRPVRHTNPVTDAGFTMIPNVILLRADLSVGAKLLYAYLKHLAWRGAQEASEPPLNTICDDLGISTNTARGYVKELRSAPAAEGGGDDLPRLVEVTRRGLGRSNVYLLNDPQILRDGSAESDIPEVRNTRVPARARSLVPVKKSAKDGEANASPVTPPLKLVDGANLAWDALAEVCSIEPSDPNRKGELSAALNGHKPNVPAGIRQLAWDGLVAAHFAADADAATRTIHDNPERFEYYLAAAIRKRASDYRTTMNGAMLTPTALAKWWLSLGKMVTEHVRPLTIEEMGEFGKLWGPGTAHETIEAARAAGVLRAIEAG